MATIEFWTSEPAIPLQRVPEAAATLEAAGWDGLSMVDSQNLASDPYVYLSLAATGTSTLGLMTGVTNVVTRHPAVTASSAFTVQSLSGGRFVLGIGRGDSALAHIGRSPARVAWFDRYLRIVTSYLNGRPVDMDDLAMDDSIAAPVDQLDLAHAPDDSQIRWAKKVERVPVEVAATGPRVIASAARYTDRVMFALGADPERVAWGVAAAKAAAEQSGRDPQSVAFGAYVTVVCDPDVASARTMGLGSASLFARFSAMHGKVAAPADKTQSDVFTAIHQAYDMNRHAREDGDQTRLLTDEFLDRFAIMGSPSYCTDRLGELVELGLTKFVVTGTSASSRDPRVAEASARFTTEVAPALRC